MRQHQKASPWGSWLCAAKTEGVFPGAPVSPSQALPRQLPQGGSQDLKSVAKASGTMTKYMGVLLPLPLGELSPQVTERAHAGKNPFRLAAARQVTFPKGTAFCSGGKLSGIAKRRPSWGSWRVQRGGRGKKTPPQAYAYGGVITLLCSLHP